MLCPLFVYLLTLVSLSRTIKWDFGHKRNFDQWCVAKIELASPDIPLQFSEE